MSVIVCPPLLLEALKRLRAEHAGRVDRHLRCAGQQNFPIGERIGKRRVVQDWASRPLGTSWVRPLRMTLLLESAEAAEAFEILAFEN